MIPIISIIIPCFNDGRLAVSAINSCIEQTANFSMEIIFVDDGSTDGSAGLILHHFSASPLVKVVRKENGGLSSARNCGLRSSVGEWVLFLDSDDLLARDFIKGVREAMRAQPAATAIVAPFSYFSDTPGSIAWSRRLLVALFRVPRFRGWYFWDRFLVRTGNCFPVSACVISRKQIAGGDLFDEGLKAHEDWDAWIRLVDGGARFAYTRTEAGNETCIRLRHGMSANSPLMRVTRGTVRQRYCQGWPYSILLRRTVLVPILALRTLAGFVESLFYRRRTRIG
ncbi:glycosyltransferase family 2 protein [uncultured Aquabacterium sp.]|uniref:glycosyltransferase family 2 protein n=1 Tax=Aquabacterium sp. TaxID=1872578 RepID=UPI00345A3BF8